MELTSSQFNKKISAEIASKLDTYGVKKMWNSEIN